MTPSAPREAQVPPAAHKSLGLNVLLDRVRGEQSFSILDLGPALEGNVRFWSQFSCRLYIGDFYRCYRERMAAVGPGKESVEAALSILLPFGDETVFNIILAWDLFNYFDLRELEALVQRLSRWCRPRTRLLALTSTQPDIPASPTIFKILNREQMIYETPTRTIRPCPRHQPRDIAKVMAGFTVAGSFLLHHGIQEYVFEFK